MPRFVQDRGTWSWVVRVVLPRHSRVEGNHSPPILAMLDWFYPRCARNGLRGSQALPGLLGFADRRPRRPARPTLAIRGAGRSPLGSDGPRQERGASSRELRPGSGIVDASFPWNLVSTKEEKEKRKRLTRAQSQRPTIKNGILLTLLRH